ncbi:MAG: EVE domain-containing protein [Paracoccaceae bacterium]
MPDWIAVASADHVVLGRAGGFMQVNHGKAAPLRRIAPGDRIAYYSSVQTYGTNTPLRAFTAIGRVRQGEVYQGVMASGSTAFRRDVDWFDANPAPIHPLLDRLELTAGRRNWGYAFRFGLVRVSEADMDVIAAAMGCPIGGAGTPVAGS